jgi:hypothetical protein
MDRDGIALDRFRASTNADLVLASRYDGMDFAYDDARLAFFPSAPYGTDPFDSFLAANFPRSGFLVGRLAERLTQALGRMTRGEDDWAVCVLEDPELGHLLSRNDILKRLPRLLASEVEDALDRVDHGLDAEVDQAVRILEGLEQVPVAGNWRWPPATAPAWLDAWSDLEAAAGDALFAGTNDVAISAATRLLEGIHDHSLRPWWLYIRAWSEALSADHDHNVGRREASLADLGSSVRAAGPTAWFGRVAAMANRLGGPGRPTAGAVDPIAVFSSERTDHELEVWRRAVETGLNSGRHNDVARAWTEVGRALGYRASQPSGGGATDSRWQGDEAVFVWEAKIEHEPDARLSRRDITQLLGQIEEERQAGQAVYGSFLTDLTEFHDDVRATAEGLAIFSMDAAREIWALLRAALVEATEARRAGHVVPFVSPPEGWLVRLIESSAGRPATVNEVRASWTRRR